MIITTTRSCSYQFISLKLPHMYLRLKNSHWHIASWRGKVWPFQVGFLNNSWQLQKYFPVLLFGSKWLCLLRLLHVNLDFCKYFAIKQNWWLSKYEPWLGSFWCVCGTDNDDNNDDTRTEISITRPGRQTGRGTGVLHTRLGCRHFGKNCRK